MEPRLKGKNTIFWRVEVRQHFGGVIAFIFRDEEKARNPPPPRVEAGSNTSTVTLGVVGGDEKGSLKYETVKYGHESYGTRTQK
jgi:hypothetical protein